MTTPLIPPAVPDAAAQVAAPIRLRSTITHTLFGVDIGGSGEIPADLLSRIPAADLARRILSGDYVAIPTAAEPDKEWLPSDLLRVVLTDRGLVVGAPITVPEDPVVGRFDVEPSANDDADADLEDAELVAAVAVAEAKLLAEQAAAAPDQAQLDAAAAALAEAQAKAAKKAVKAPKTPKA